MVFRPCKYVLQLRHCEHSLPTLWYHEVLNYVLFLVELPDYSDRMDFFSSLSIMKSIVASCNVQNHSFNALEHSRRIELVVEVALQESSSHRDCTDRA